MKEKMKGSSRRLVLASLAGLCIFALAAIIVTSGTALATPGFQFNSEILSQVFFESIDVGTLRHRHDRHEHGRRGHDHDDCDEDEHDSADPGDFRVKIKVRDPADVYVVRNKVPVGGHSGWHTHPGPSVVSIKAGVATVYSGDDPSCAGVVYPAGTGFIDEGGDHSHLVRNEGTLELETVAFQIVPKGAQRRIDLPDPGFCPFTLP